MSPILYLGLGLGALALFANGKGSASGTTMPFTGPTGKKWLVELVGKSGTEGSYLVYEPANPPLHDKYPVLQFSQLGDSPLRKLVARYPSVPADVYNQAMSDFQVKATF